jgi:TPR repeat protein
MALFAVCFALMAHAQDFEAVKYMAEQGDADAQFNLGWMYANGQGVAKNDAEVVKWYRKAAEQGHARAQTILGAMYTEGRRVAKNDAEAAKWFQKAAEQGDKRAQDALAALRNRTSPNAQQNPNSP